MRIPSSAREDRSTDPEHYAPYICVGSRSESLASDDCVPVPFKYGLPIE